MSQRHECSEAKTFRSASAASSTPAMGVHSPAIRSSPRPIENVWDKIAASDGPGSSAEIPSMTNAIPVAKRISKSPTPGGPWAKLENSRRTTVRVCALTVPR